VRRDHAHGPARVGRDGLEGLRTASSPYVALSRGRIEGKDACEVNAGRLLAARR